MGFVDSKMRVSSYEYPDNCSLLQAAIDGGHVDVVAALLRHRADPNVWNPVQKTSPLHTAVQVSVSLLPVW